MSVFKVSLYWTSGQKNTIHRLWVEYAYLLPCFCPQLVKQLLQSLIGTSFCHLNTLVPSLKFAPVCNCLWCAGKQHSGIILAVSAPEIVASYDGPWTPSLGISIYGSETSTLFLSKRLFVYTSWYEYRSIIIRLDYGLKLTLLHRHFSAIRLSERNMNRIRLFVKIVICFLYHNIVFNICNVV